MKDAGKTRNRFHSERIAAKRKNYRGRGHVVRDTPAVCSCWMCGNPRRHFGEQTIQERRAVSISDFKGDIDNGTGNGCKNGEGFIE